MAGACGPRDHPRLHRRQAGLRERKVRARPRAFVEQGDTRSAEPLFRDAWRTASLQPEAEEQLLDIFGDLLTRADDKARMERRLYANDVSGALRAAHRLGGVEPAIVKARAAVNEKSPTGKSLIEALPSSAHQDPGVMFSRIQMLRRADKYHEAAQLMLAAPRDVALIYDPDEWWIERRLIARKLLDLNQAATAYKIVRDAATPTKENFKVEHEFTAGWIALRFLKDPAGAAQHFARITGLTNPIAMARANYWRGRAAEAMNKPQDARAFYEQAARYNTAYYGQLARAKLGMHELALVPTPLPASDKRAALARNEVVRAVETLYALNDRDLIIPIVADLADRSPDMAMLAALAEVAARHDDARSALLIGKGALGRGQPFDHYAFPTFGLPPYTAIGPAVEPAVVYSIARQESAFNPKDVSSAHALGLMQVTPEAGRYVAKKFNVAFDQDRLLNDNVYNMQIGSRRARRQHRELQRLVHPCFRRLQCGPWPGQGMDRALRRSARSQGRPDRLGRAHPVLRDAELRAAHHREHPGLSRAFRRRLAPDDRGRPAPRRQRQLATKPP